VNAKVIAVVVNVKVVDAGREGAGPVPVTVITAPETIAAVVEAEIAKLTVHVATGLPDGVQVADAGVATEVTPLGRADSATRTGAETPAVVVTVIIWLAEPP
jgi:hypothetical protein